MCLPAPPSDLTFDTDANTFQGPWFCRDASWLGSATTMGRAFVIRGSVLADGWHFRDSLHYGSRPPNLVVSGLAEGVAQPLETLVETVSGGSASRLDVPGTLSEAVKTELVGDLSGVHGVGQILLVGEDEEKSITELVLVEHTLKLLAGLDNTVAIVGVDDEDDTLGVLEVMSPERTDLVLSTDIPHGELNVLVLDSLDVEADCGDGGDDFTELQLVQNGGLSGGIETNHEDSHLLLAPQAVEQLGKGKTHIGGGM
jgi:hypothetical protein